MQPVLLISLEDLPPNISVTDIWSIVLYDNQTRSMLQTGDPHASITSQKKADVINSDTSVDIYFGRKGPGNWMQTVPRQGWKHDPAPINAITDQVAAGGCNGEEALIGRQR